VARSLFGGRPGDFVVQSPSANAGFVKVGASLTTGTAWTAATGGTQITDLLTSGGAATSTLSSDADGVLVPVFGPDPLNAFWCDFGGGRRLIESQTFAADLATAARTSAITAAAADATAKANAAQANAIAATSGIAAPIVQNSDGTLPSRLTVSGDRTQILVYRLVRTDVAITTAAVSATGSTAPTPNDLFFYAP
jgi:hypothetical protein